jgi:hypothetical protein
MPEGLEFLVRQLTRAYVIREICLAASMSDLNTES